MNIRTLQQVINPLGEKHGISILHVVECSSRAWGFATPESDHDIFVIYVNIPWMAEIQNNLETFNEKIWLEDEQVEITVQGIELRRFFTKMTSSSFSAYEILNSPMLYAANKLLINDWMLLQRTYADPVRMIDACRGVVKKNLYIKELTPKLMLHGLRYALITNQLSDGNLSPDLRLPVLLKGSPLEDLSESILTARTRTGEFEPISDVVEYMKRVASQPTPSSAEKPQQRDDQFFRAANEIYQRHMVGLLSPFSAGSVVYWPIWSTSIFE